MIEKYFNRNENKNNTNISINVFSIIINRITKNV